MKYLIKLFIIYLAPSEALRECKYLVCGGDHLVLENHFWQGTFGQDHSVLGWNPGIQYSQCPPDY